MIIRVKPKSFGPEGQVELRPLLCDDDGTELFSLEPAVVMPGDGDVLDIRLPNVDPWSFIQIR